MKDILFIFETDMDKPYLFVWICSLVLVEDT